MEEKELIEEKLDEVSGGRSISPKINLVLCTKCGATVNTSTNPYTCPNCGELKTGEYRSTNPVKARFI
ncbi:MAG: hypothetical protein ACI4WM_02050 [Erysipelotrichaceae bacterium]